MTNERKNITQPADWWVEFETQAQKEGMTLSGWIGKVCMEAIPKTKRVKLSKRPPAHRPTKSKE